MSPNGEKHLSKKSHRFRDVWFDYWRQNLFRFPTLPTIFIITDFSLWFWSKLCENRVSNPLSHLARLFWRNSSTFLFESTILRAPRVRLGLFCRSASKSRPLASFFLPNLSPTRNLFRVWVPCFSLARNVSHLYLTLRGWMCGNDANNASYCYECLQK